MRGSQKNKDYIIKWTSQFAYAIGLFTADGCLSSDGHHLEFCSKDREQVINFKRCLDLDNRITKKTRAQEKIKKYYRVQFSNVRLYEFMETIGLKPAKSKTLSRIDIPPKFFADFLRGFFDGDGNFQVSRHPESQYPQIRVRFASASPQFLRWLSRKIEEKIHTKGGYLTKVRRAEHLVYATEDSLRILEFMYYCPDIICLSRKFQKIRFYLK